MLRGNMYICPAPLSCIWVRLVAKPSSPLSVVKEKSCACKLLPRARALHSFMFLVCEERETWSKNAAAWDSWLISALQLIVLDFPIPRCTVTHCRYSTMGTAPPMWFQLAGLTQRIYGIGEEIYRVMMNHPSFCVG